MEINLHEVIKYNVKCIQNRSLLSNIISDKYPGKDRERNILLNVYDIGLIRDIAHNRSVTELQYINYIQKIVDTYALQEEAAIQGLNAWINVFLGEGYAEELAVKSNVIVDKKINKIIGNMDDYELTMLSDTTAEIKLFKGEDVEELVVPAEINGIRIVGIGFCAFSCCPRLHTVQIEEGIEYIETEALSACHNLSKIIIPSTVKTIGSYAFAGCYNLHTVYLEEGLVEIDFQAFGGCESLLEITIPSTVEKIGIEAFINCNNLHTVYLKEGIKYIEDEAFYGCESLYEITIPSTVKEIGLDAFVGCCNLRTVRLNTEANEIDISEFLWHESVIEIITPSRVIKTRECGI